MDTEQTRQTCFVLLLKTWSWAATHLTIHSQGNAEGVADDFFRSSKYEHTLKWRKKNVSPATFPSVCAGMLEQKCRGQLLRAKGMDHTTGTWWRGLSGYVTHLIIILQSRHFATAFYEVDTLTGHMAVGCLWHSNLLHDSVFYLLVLPEHNISALNWCFYKNRFTNGLSVLMDTYWELLTVWPFN